MLQPSWQCYIFLKIKLNFRKLSSDTPDPQTVIYEKQISNTIKKFQNFQITKQQWSITVGWVQISYKIPYVWNRPILTWSDLEIDPKSLSRSTKLKIASKMTIFDPKINFTRQVQNVDLTYFFLNFENFSLKYPFSIKIVKFFNKIL